MNLTLETPAHEKVPPTRAGQDSTASGFHLDRDCPSDEGCNGQNEENVYFDGPGASEGPLRGGDPTLVDLHGLEAPVKVRFGARLGTRVVGFDVDLATDDEARKRFTFDLP